MPKDSAPAPGELALNTEVISRTSYLMRTAGIDENHVSRLLDESECMDPAILEFLQMFTLQEVFLAEDRITVVNVPGVVEILSQGCSIFSPKYYPFRTLFPSLVVRVE